MALCYWSHHGPGLRLFATDHATGRTTSRGLRLVAMELRYQSQAGHPVRLVAPGHTMIPVANRPLCDWYCLQQSH